MLRRGLVATAVAGLLVFAADRAGAQSETVTVAIHHYEYQPADLDVTLGQTVVWRNDDTARHDIETVTGPGTLSSGLLEKGQTFGWTPATAGVYQYVCTIHDDMGGSVTVRAPATTLPAAPTAAATVVVSSTTTTSTLVSRPAVALAPAGPEVSSLRGFGRPVAVAAAAVAFGVALVALDRRRVR